MEVVETSRNGDANQGITRALLFEIIINCSGGCSMPK